MISVPPLYYNCNVSYRLRVDPAKTFLALVVVIFALNFGEEDPSIRIFV
jgi:hypothetical protein